MEASPLLSVSVEGRSEEAWLTGCVPPCFTQAHHRPRPATRVIVLTPVHGDAQQFGLLVPDLPVCDDGPPSLHLTISLLPGSPLHCIVAKIAISEISKEAALSASVFSL